MTHPATPDLTRRETATASSYRVRWYPEPPPDSAFTHAVREAFGTPETDGTVGEVWVIDPEAASCDRLLSLLHTGALPDETDAAAAGGPRYGLFLFLTTHSLKGWDPPEPPTQELRDAEDGNTRRWRTLKSNEYLLRVLRSYGLARVVQWEPDAEDGAERLKQELHGFRERSPELRDLRSGLRQLMHDVARLQQIAQAELDGHAWNEELKRRLSASEEGQAEARGGEVLEPVVTDVNREARSVAARLREQFASPEAFVRALRAVYQLGNRPHVIAERELGEAVPVIGQRGSILFHRDLDLLVTAFDEEGGPSKEVLDLRLRMQGRLWVYELLRDLAYWLAYAANEWARTMVRQIRRPISVLIIDEVFEQAKVHRGSRSERLAQDLKERLARMCEAFRPEQPSELVLDASGNPAREHVRFEYVTAERAWPHVREHVEFGQALKSRPLFDDGAEPADTDLFRYDLILVEVEFRGTDVGPAIVEKLTAHLEREAHARSVQRTPAIIVLSQTANFSRVQQCLNLGAVAFVRKERMYELPTRVTRARITQRAVEPQGQKANFRALYSLPHEEISRLQSTTRDDCILGHGDARERRWLQTLPKADLHTHIGTHIDLETIQALSFNTVGHLLDRRVGNREMAVGVDALIDEVCTLVVIVSHLRQRDSAHPADLFNQAADGLFGRDEVIEKKAKENETPPYALLVARLKGRHHKINAFEITSLMVAVLALARERFRVDGGDPEVAGPLRPWQYLEDMHGWLRDAWKSVVRTAPDGDDDVPGTVHARATDEERAAPHLAATDGSGDDERGQRPGDPFNGWLTERKLRVEQLLGHISDRVSRRAEELRAAVQLDPVRVPGPNGQTLARVHRWLQDQEVREEADEERVLRSMRAPMSVRGELRRCVRRVARRVPFTWWKLNRRFEAILEHLADHPFPVVPEAQLQLAAHAARDFLSRGPADRERAQSTLHKLFDPPSLHDLVVIPEHPHPAEKTLLRYLWGTELLGADHLQYPENLLLAARSVARQSAAENVWYTELRCETVGYTQGGMVAVDATDLLCTALDIAVAYGVDHPEEPAAGQERDEEWARKKRWVRFNILLGAKRHKPPATFKQIVDLTAYYMKQREEEEDRLHRFAPIWWKPTTVAGFDLSGNENAEQKRPRKMIKPLFKYSTPITIHAGEAASAESIWQAVYLYGARRIGHGLRLRENRRLLNHCISEGLCMELCPISNAYTNSFPVAAPDYESDWWEYYPLRYYMEQGLDLCINTDNRQLHPEGRNTLTDEYLCAAALSGGLSRWEVLRIVKAAFKHAFLPKREVGVMLRAVESHVYELITDPDPLGRTRERVYVGEQTPIASAPDDAPEPAPTG